MPKMSESLHQHYKDLSPLWRRCKLAYYGGAAYVEEALVSHVMENAQFYRERKARATLLNYMRPICDTYGNYLFRPKWNINVPAKIKYLETNCDRRGTAMVDFFKSLVPLAAAVGFAAIGVDEPVADPEIVRTEAAADAFGIRPYFYLIDPLDLLTWATNEDGDLTLALVRETNLETKITADGIETNPVTVYRLWTPDLCQVFNDDGAKLSEYPNKASVVPLTTLKFRDIGDPIIGQGLGQDLEPVQADILNTCSRLDEIHAKQTFSQLVGKGSVEEFSEGGDISKVGTSSIIVVGPEGDLKYISPDASQANLLSDHINKSVDEMYRLAQLVRGSVREGAMASGISKAFDFLDTNQALSDVGRNCAHTMRKCLLFAARFAGVTGDITIESPIDYGVQDVNTDIDNLGKLKLAGASNALLMSLEKKIASQLFQKDAALLQDIENEGSAMDAYQQPEPPQFNEGNV